MKITNKIVEQITIVLLFAVLIPFITIGIIISNISQQSMRNELTYSAKMLAQNLGEEIQTYLHDSQKRLDAVAAAIPYFVYAQDAKDYIDEIEKQINELSEFVKWPFCNLLNNVEIIDEKNIKFIIKDRYNLLGINVTKEQFEVENVEALEIEIKKIQTSYYIKKNKIDIEEMKNICEIKKLLDK